MCNQPTTHDTRELKDLLGLDRGTVEAIAGRAQYFLDHGHFERALMMLELLEELDGNNPLPVLMAIDCLLALGCSEAAERKVRQLLARDPENPEALVAWAEVQIAAGELAPAAETLARVLHRDPTGSTKAGQRALAVAAAAHHRWLSA